MIDWLHLKDFPLHFADEDIASQFLNCLAELIVIFFTIDTF
jgi:hypothetical protein